MDRSYLITIKNLLRLFLLPLILPFAPEVAAHGNGAPLSRCDTMVPGHWVQAQTTPSPYQIILSQTDIKEGQSISISITSEQNTPFKGFLIMVKKPGDDSQNYGQFNMKKMNMEISQPLACFGREGSAVTHVQNNPKQSMNLEWVAPILNGVSVDEYEVRATVVQDFFTIWTNITHKIRIFKHKQLNPKQNPEPTETKRDALSVPRNSSLSDQESQNGQMGTIGSLDSVEKDSWNHFKRMWLQLQNFFGLEGQKLQS